MVKDTFKEEFTCVHCKHTRFSREYIFFMRFQEVDFSDDLVYDRVTEEIYMCQKCGKRTSLEDIKQGLRDIKAKHKHIDKGNGDV